MFLLDLCPGLIVSIYWTLICVCMEGLNAVKTQSHTNPLPSEFIKQGRNQSPSSKPVIWTFFFFKHFCRLDKSCSTDLQYSFFIYCFPFLKEHRWVCLWTHLFKNETLVEHLLYSKHLLYPKTVFQSYFSKLH